MVRFFVRRLMYTAFMIMAMAVFLFAMSRAAGDPRFLYLNEYTTDQDWEDWGVAMGLNRPLYVQFGNWFGNALTGDFGDSIKHRREALPVVLERIPATLQLAATGIISVIVVSLPLGILSAVKRGSVFDLSGRTFALLGQSAPSFWVGIILIVIFSVYLGLLPTSGRGSPAAFIMPTITLAWGSAAGLLRLVRSSMLEVMDSEYIKLARAKGVGTNMVIWKHAFKNSLITPLTYTGLMIAAFVDGSVVVETVFAWPGVGRLGIDAINNNDFPILVCICAMVTILYVALAFIVDLLYAFVDPRIRIN